MKLTWESGESGVVRQLVGEERVVVDATMPAAPGTPLSGLNAEGLAYRLKVKSCRKIADDPLCYRLEGRLLNITREARERLRQELLTASSDITAAAKNGAAQS
jgi:hypothetical protein